MNMLGIQSGMGVHEMYNADMIRLLANGQRLTKPEDTGGQGITGGRGITKKGGTPVLLAAEAGGMRLFF